MDKSQPTGYFGVALYCPQNLLNIGAVLRSAYAFGASYVSIIGKGYKTSRVVASDTCRAYEKMPVFNFIDYKTFEESRPKNCSLIAVELTDNAKGLPSFRHPDRAIYIFGAEGGSLPKKITDSLPTLIIPTRVCLNLSNAVAVTIYDRIAKEHKPTKILPLPN